MKTYHLGLLVLILSSCGGGGSSGLESISPPETDNDDSYNDNQMSFCARDTGIFLGLVIGFMYASRKRTVLTLPLVIAALIPIGLDGTIQLLTDYESTNPKRLITGLIAGAVTGVAIKIIADSLDNK